MSRDAAAVGDGTPPATVTSSFCADAGPVKHCIDFDTPAQATGSFGFDELFDDTDHPPAGKLTIVGTDSVSAPNNLRVETLDGGAAQGDFVVSPAGAFPGEIYVHTRVRYDLLQPGGSTSSHFLSLRCRKTNAGRVYLKVTQNGALGLKQDTSTGTDPPSADSFRPNAWHEVEVRFRWSASPPNVSVTLDGAQPFGPSQPLEPFSCSGGESLVLRLGSFVSNASLVGGDYVFRFDDIVADWK